ncbi:MAG: hypothetical protein L0Y56_00645, partial [Nitrospira sp.]|nr:hypothetical protein [Nitrospira sp.]
HSINLIASRVPWFQITVVKLIQWKFWEFAMIIANMADVLNFVHGSSGKFTPPGIYPGGTSNSVSLNPESGITFSSVP